MRDFYDIYMLTKLQGENINQNLLVEALNATVFNRGKVAILERKDLVISEVGISSKMKNLWSRYQKNYDYAKDVSWDEVMSVLKNYFQE